LLVITDTCRILEFLKRIAEFDSVSLSFQSIISDYFLAQRIKPKQNNEAGRQQYIDQTLLLQQIIVSAMKSKQTVDKSEPGLVSTLLNQFVELYFDEHGKEHLNTMQKNN
jgi:nickel superoxide dismutase